MQVPPSRITDQNSSRNFDFIKEKSFRRGSVSVVSIKIWRKSANFDSRPVFGLADLRWGILAVGVAAKASARILSQMASQKRHPLSGRAIWLLDRVPVVIGRQRC